MPRQLLPLLSSRCDKPTPLMSYIHGGGWVKGEKGAPGGTTGLLHAGISIVTIEYRFVQQAIAANVKPPAE